jgi:hypothetical protein
MVLQKSTIRRVSHSVDICMASAIIAGASLPQDCRYDALDCRACLDLSAKPIAHLSDIGSPRRAATKDGTAE